MKRYGIFDETSGAVLRTISCSPAMAPLQCAEGEGFFEWPPEIEQPDESRYKVVNGVLVESARKKTKTTTN